MRKVNKKVAAVLGAGAVAVAGSGVAFAYWTTSGSGTGSAGAGTVPAGTSNVTITQTSDNTGYSLGDVKNVVVTAANTLGYSVNVGAVNATPADSTGTNGGTCAAANWVFTPSNTAVGTLTKSGTTTATKTGIVIGTLQLADNESANQDNCKGAAPSLSFSAVAGS